MPRYEYHHHLDSDSEPVVPPPRASALAYAPHDTHQHDPQQVPFIMLPAFAARNDPGAGLLPVKRSDLSRGELLPCARARVALDVHVEMARRLNSHRISLGAASNQSATRRTTTNQGTLTRVKREVAAHYGISVRTVESCLRRAREGAGFEDRARSGRPTVLSLPGSSDVKRAIVEARNSNGGRSLRSTCLALEYGGPLPWATRYRGAFSRASPSLSTIRKVLQEGRIRRIHQRPMLTCENKAARASFAADELARPLDERVTRCMMLDECFITTRSAGLGTVVDHPDARVDESHLSRFVRHKTLVDGIMVLAVVALPELLNPEAAGAGSGERAVFHPAHDGKVALVRVCRTEHYKRTVYATTRDAATGKRQKLLRDDGAPVVLHEKGDARAVAVTMDGAAYRDILTRRGGVFDSVRAYLGSGDVEQVRLQQDGAPAHGFDYRHRGRCTKDQTACMLEGVAQGVTLFKQPPNSPELNVLDLGVWWALKARVREKLGELGAVMSPGRPHDHGDEVREPEGGRGPVADLARRKRMCGLSVEDRLWEVTKEAWAELPARVIWNCFMARDEVMRDLVRTGGEPTTREPHEGVRRAWGTW